MIAAVVFVIALSRSAGLADRKMEEIYMLSDVRETGGVDGNYIFFMLLYLSLKSFSCRENNTFPIVCTDIQSTYLPCPAPRFQACFLP